MVIIIHQQKNHSLLQLLKKKEEENQKAVKLTIKSPEKENLNNTISNVILHLKCSLNDLSEHNLKFNKIVTNPLEYNPDIPLNILTYNQTTNDSGFSLFNTSSSFEENNSQIITDWNSGWIDTKEGFQNNIAYSNNLITSQEKKINEKNSSKTTYVYNPEITSLNNQENISSNSANLSEEFGGSKNQNDNYVEITQMTENIDCLEENVNLKEINNKLKKIKINLYKNQNINKKSACFWCTCDFDNPTCYIPKYEMDDKIYGYGSFCRPECAVAYLMKEHIDDSTKFERYHLLNHIYSKVYGFKKNIKPAPCPYFLLDKFYGNLSIQEYRKLLKTEHMLLVIDKPMTRILPELHEENEDLISNIYGSNKPVTQNQSTATNNTGVYKVQRQSEKQQGPSKSSILRDKFGL